MVFLWQATAMPEKKKSDQMTSPQHPQGFLGVFGGHHGIAIFLPTHAGPQSFLTCRAP